jgi:Fe-S-cluster-containing dehydrogenase component
MLARRLTALDELRTLAPDGSIPRAALPAISVSDKCTHDAVCAGVCPTAALRTYAIEGMQGLIFDAGRCLDCGRCVSACPHQAIGFAPAGGTAELHVVSRHTTRVCSACDDSFASSGDDEFCPTCRKSRSFFTGALGLRASGEGLRPLPNGTALYGLARGDTTP